MMTPQQVTAIATRGVSVVLASGAGCGKTTVLVERYLSHLVNDGADVSRLVAMTFTDKATREMRKRIREAIEKRVQNTREERWRIQLRELETAPIGTIHSYCSSLLRRHALAIGLDPGFQVLDAAIAGNLQSDAVRDTLNGLLTDESDAGRALRKLIVLYGWTTVRTAIGDLLERPGDWQRDLDCSDDELAERWREAAGGEFRRDVVRQLLDNNGKVGRGVRYLRETPCTGPKMRANLGILFAELDALAETCDLAGALERVQQSSRVQGTEAAKAWPDADYDRIKSSLEEIRNKLPERLALFAEDPDDLVPAARVGRQFLAVASACRDTFALAKRRAGGLDFDDQLLLTRDLLRDSGVRAECRRRIQFLMVDELQDTDPVQMEIVHLLCGEGLAGGKLFAVGDAKQSIYRFRGADVALFERLRSDVPDAGHQSLTKNFRSQPAILDFTNALVGDSMADYEPLVPGLAQLGDHPCVEFLFGPEGDNVDASRRAEADRIARRIVDLIESRTAIVTDRGSTLRPARAGDIVMLFRAMTNVGLYETALRNHGLDYYVVGGRAFFAQQEVYDLANLLRTLENPNQSIALAGTLRSPFGCLSDDALVLLASHPRGLWAGLHDAASRKTLPKQDRPTAERVTRWLDDWRQQKDRLPVAMLLRRILADSGYDAALRYEFMGERKLANLWKMIDLARSFDRPGRRGLADFLQHLEQLITAQPREEQAATQPEESDAVRLMSIHQAKGLEFPVVILPDLAAKTQGPTGSTVLWDRDLGPIPKPPKDDDPPLFTDYPQRLWRTRETLAERAEDLRTLYVACTRAADYLIFSGSLAEPVKATNTAIGVLTEQFDLATGDCRSGEVAVNVVHPAPLADSRSGRTDKSVLHARVGDPARVAPIPTNTSAQHNHAGQSPTEA